MSTNLGKPLRLRNDSGAQLQLERSGTTRSFTLQASNVTEYNGIIAPTGLTTPTATITGGTINGTTIGATTASTGAFTTLSATGTVTGGKFAPTANTTAGNGMYLPTTNTLAFSTNGVERIQVTSGGNVGIGVTPNTTLEVAGNVHVSGGDRTIFNRSNNSLQLGTNNTARVAITAGGNVGVNTTAPQGLLDMQDGVFINRSQQAAFNTTLNQYEDFELCRFATTANFSQQEAGYQVFVGRVTFHIGAFRRTSTNHQNNGFAAASVTLGNVPAAGSSGYPIGNLNVESLYYVDAATSGTMTIALALEYSTDGGTTWTAAPSSTSTTINTAALFRVRANVTGTTPNNFVGRFFVNTAIQGFLTGTEISVNSLAISII
jgi:hypothetical protein